MAERALVYFLCTANACRSQMAEGWARQLLPPPWQAASAGVEPTELDQRAVAAMAELGVDISAQSAKAIDPALLRSARLVITLCADADQRCPVLPAQVARRHWPLPDPAQAAGSAVEVQEVFRQVRDSLRTRLEALAQELAHFS